MRHWFVAETGDEDLGFEWELMLQHDDSDRIKCVGQFQDESVANEVLNALKWLDAMGSARLSLVMSGVTFKEPSPKPKARRKAPVKAVRR